MLAYNSYGTPNLNDLSPFELVFGRNTNIVPTLELMPPIPVTGTFHQAKQLLDKKLTYLRTILKKFRDKRYAIMNNNNNNLFSLVNMNMVRHNGSIV